MKLDSSDTICSGQADTSRSDCRATLCCTKRKVGQQQLRTQRRRRPQQHLKQGETAATAVEVVFSNCFTIRFSILHRGYKWHLSDRDKTWSLSSCNLQIDEIAKSAWISFLSTSSLVSIVVTWGLYHCSRVCLPLWRKRVVDDKVFWCGHEQRSLEAFKIVKEDLCGIEER